MEWIKRCEGCGELVFKTSITEEKKCKCGEPWEDESRRFIEKSDG